MKIRLCFDQRQTCGFISLFIEKLWCVTVQLQDLVHELLRHLRVHLGKDRRRFCIGDMWEYPGLPFGWAPFHKLTLWLTLSLIEPLQTAGLNVIEIEQIAWISRIS